MGFLSKAWKGVKKTVKKVGDVTGIDKVITALPGTKEQAAQAAKIAAIAATVYYGGGALMSSLGSSAAGTTGTLYGAGSGLGGAGAMGGMSEGAMAALGGDFGGMTAGGLSAFGAGGAGTYGGMSGAALGALGGDFGSGLAATYGAGAGEIGGLSSGALGALNTGSGLASSFGAGGDFLSSGAEGGNSTLSNLSKLLGGNNGIGANLGGALGSYLGGKEQAQGYEDAQKILEQMGQKADYASKLSDPFQSYRPGYAQQLDDTLQGRRSITTDPGYQFQFNEGQRAVERAAGARGMGNSGNVMTALQQRGQDVASQQYGTIIDRLTNLAGASSQNAQAGGQIYGNMMGTALQGQASAALGQGMTNAASTGGVSSGLGGALGSLAGSYLGSQGGQQMIGNIGSKIASFF